MNQTVTRRRVFAGGGGVLASVLLAACGGQRGETGTVGSGRFAQPVTIDFAHRWEGVREPLIEQQIRDFASVQPNIKINALQVFCSGGGEGCIGGMDYGKVTAQIAADTPPDVFMAQSFMAADYAFRGALYKLNDLAKRDRIDLPKTFYPALIQMGTYQGNVIGFPQLSAGDSPYLYMSTQLWQASGLDVNKPPKNWEELVSHAQKMTVKGGGPGGFERIGFEFPNSFIGWAGRNNTKILSDDASKVLFNSQEGQDTLQWMFSTMQQLYGKWENRAEFMRANQAPGTGGGRVPYYTNKVGMWSSGVWHFFEIKGEKELHNPNFQYSAALIPHNARNAQAKPASVADGVWLYSIPANAKKTEAAFEWLKYITMGEGNRLFVKAQNRPSPAIKINEDPDFSKDNPFWNTVVKRALEIMVPLPQTPAWPRLSSALGKMQNDVISGAKAPREALAEAAREAQVLLDEVRR
jgi:ABC-type glycerol-3-phosphate transport system substrate-binding protein